MRTPRSSQEAMVHTSCLLSWSPALQAAFAAAAREYEAAGSPDYALFEENRRERYYREAGRRLPADPVVTSAARRLRQRRLKR